MIFTTNSTEETEKIGERLCLSLLNRGDKQVFISLRGEMGVGKTAFVRGFCRPLGISGVRSPTYTVVNEYRGTRNVYHFDMYRISSSDDLYSIGYDEYIASDAFSIAEWSENVEDELPPWQICVSIERCPDTPDSRRINIMNGIQI